MPDDQWAKDAVRRLADQCRGLRSDAVRSVSVEPYRGQGPTPTPGMQKEGPSGIAERYRALSQSDSGTKGRPRDSAVRAVPMDRSQLGELKPTQTPEVKTPEKGRER
jgi:hypothetical protein